MLFNPVLLAFTLALVGGALLGSGHWVLGAILAVLAVGLYGLALLGRERGEDDRHLL